MTNHFQVPIGAAFLIVFAIGMTNIQNDMGRVVFCAGMCLLALVWMALTPWLNHVSQEQQMRWHRERKERRRNAAAAREKAKSNQQENP